VRPMSVITLDVVESLDLEARALMGDADAFSEMIREWDHDLRGVVWMVVGSAHATDEVMQHSYEKAFRSIARFDGGASLKTWLHTVSLRSAIDHTRRSSYGQDDDVAELGSPPVVPDVATSAIASAELGKSFDTLEKVDQLLLMLTVGLGYSFDETATIVGLPLGTVASKVGQARTGLWNPNRTVELEAAMTKERHDTELHEFLQSRIPEPGPGYWENITNCLNEGDQGEEPSAASDASAVCPTPRGKPDDSTTAMPSVSGAWLVSHSRSLLVATVVVLIVGFGIFALGGQSADDLVDLASTSDQIGEADGPLSDGSLSAGSLSAGEGQQPDATSESTITDEVPPSTGLDPAASPYESADWPLDDAVLSSAGLGAIRIGMMVSELSVELGTTIEIETINGNMTGECGSISTPAIASEVWIMVELTSSTDAIIRRVTVSDSRWFTPSGMAVGVSEQTILDTFPGQIESSPHKYVEGNYLTFQPTDANDPSTVQFVSEGGLIVQIHAGDRNWVGLVEGCA
jgi:RNA polymerase sigma-70 factor (ECF subfamily)